MITVIPWKRKEKKTRMVENSNLVSFHSPVNYGLHLDGIRLSLVLRVFPSCKTVGCFIFVFGWDFGKRNISTMVLW